MNKLFTLIIVSVFFQISFSQVWSPPGAVWNYTFKSDWINNTQGYTEIRYIGDTTIHGKLCNKLFYQRYAQHIIMIYPPLQPEFKMIYTHNDSGLVTFSNGSQHFDTLANFNSAIGKGWYFPRLTHCQGSNPSDYSVIVIDTGHVMINGFNLKYVEIISGDSATMANPPLPGMGFKVVERIGFRSGFLYLRQAFCENIVDQWDREGSFSCYWDDEFPVYALPGKQCTYFNPVDIDEINQQEQFYVYPNPSTGKFFATVNEPALFSIYNSLGIIIETLQFIPNEKTEIDLTTQPNGLYFIRNNDFKNTQIIKILKN